MSLYMRFLLNAFLSKVAYKFDAYLGVISQCVFLFIHISIWKALYISAEIVDVSSIDLKTMITYSVISAGISLFINNSVIGIMDQKIRTGEIAIDLLRPMNLKTTLFYRKMGDTCFVMIFQFLPVVMIFSFILRINYPSIEFLLYFFITLINGMIIYFLITYIIGLIGFWYLSVWHLSRLLQDLVRLLSGSFIPLWFFPDILSTISLYLPFRFIYFVPISIFLGKVDVLEIYIMIALQIMWILILTIIEKVLWFKGIEKLVIQGG
ncbi:ABC transporter permease [Alkaliphilus peptidifermentans]|uniref:ABC-2 type transport system permease protein n=1 Tax=Alkaliphilus peptidifermentans DSM 18978 TaxID=1120976 RepID=A0A1G5LAN5_9FIRM|nr:ABC-2 family transporter protein [Alkaliphilus peptidifermentans]SCZ09511.1 ABC-2 type transport system permease protein [Alkaliphilus peptidifermentans DSM 18978]